MMRKKEAECSYDTSPIDMEEGVNDIKYDNIEKYDEGKEAEFLHGTPPAEIEESVGDRNDDNSEDN